MSVSFQREHPNLVAPNVRADAVPTTSASSGRKRRKHHKRKRQFSDDEEHARRRAESAATMKARLVREFCEYAIVVGVIFFFSESVAFIVGLVWGAHLVGEFVKRILEPSLRGRWVRKEVSREIAGRVGRERRQIQDQHTRSIETLSASIAHEIRNPIAAARSLVQQMGEDPRSQENVQFADVALDELDRVERSISHLLRYAREQEISFRPLVLSDVVESALEVFRERASRLEARIDRDLESQGIMNGDAEQLRRVFVNLIANSLDAFEGSGTTEPTIEVTVGENLAGSEVWAKVRDNGAGIPGEALEKIFNPFYTSKNEGTGLGLAVSKKVVDAHGGSLEAHSEPGRGTEFVLRFPKRQRKDNAST